MYQNTNKSRKNISRTSLYPHTSLKTFSHTSLCRWIPPRTPPWLSHAVHLCASVLACGNQGFSVAHDETYVDVSADDETELRRCIPPDESWWQALPHNMDWWRRSQYSKDNRPACSTAVKIIVLYRPWVPNCFRCALVFRDIPLKCVEAETQPGT